MAIDALAPEAVSEPGYRVDVIERIGPEWDALVASFADTCLEQSAAYLGPRLGLSRLCGLLLREAATNEPLAAVLAVTAVVPLLHIGLAYVKFGPLWRRRGRPVQPGVLVAALDAVRQVFAVERGLVVRVMPPPDPDHAADWTAALAAARFSAHAPVPDPERYLVDLTLREDEQLKSLGASWRANLAKARGLDVREVDVRAALPDFLALYGAMRARKKFADHHHTDILPAVVAAAPAGLGLRLFLAYENGAPVAGSLIAGAERVFVLASAGNARGLALRAGYAVRWAIISRLRGSEARWLDLGGDEGDEGLRSFKHGNVGKRGQIVTLPGEFDHAGTALSRAAAAALTFTHGVMHSGLAQRLTGR